MKKWSLAIGLIVVGTVLFFAGQAYSLQKGKRGPSDEFKFVPPTQKEVMDGMANWQKIGSPGKMHGRLEHFVGKWKTSTSMTFGPGAPPMKSEGTCETKWVMSGRYLFSHQKGTMMGQARESMHFFGYDNYKKQFVANAIDTMSTGIMHMLGAPDKSGNAIILYGQMDEPMSNEQKNVKFVVRILSENKHVEEIHDLTIGETNTMVMKIEYERVTD